MNLKNKRIAAGFTLLELMVTIAVIVIIVTIGVPAFRTTIANSRIETTSNSLRNSFVIARNKAIETASRVKIAPVLSGDWDNWKIGSAQQQSAVGSTTINSTSASIEFTEDGSLGEETLAYQVFSVCYTGNNEDIKPRAVVVSPGGLILIKQEVQLIDLSINCSTGP